MQNIHSGPFRDDADFWRIRDLVIKTYANTGLGWNWDLRRWDGARFYNANQALNSEWQPTIQLWETPDGRLAGTVNGEGRGLFYLQIHPQHRRIEQEMVSSFPLLHTKL